MTTESFQAASQNQIDDLLSGERTRVKAAVDQLPREELIAALSTPAGEQALAHAFELMPSYYTAGKFDHPVLVRYRVERLHGGAVERDVTFGPANCLVGPVESTRTPDLTVIMDALSFVEAATGISRGMVLLMRGDLKVQGNVQIALKMEAFFGLAPAGGKR
ncbi:MAG TPA: SCP2 sterol-binding domain-containing protein [Mycobacterium sp.]|nr:SCP2 sterol-binding domain-containing protein [Mycobacterium sp.]